MFNLKNWGKLAGLAVATVLSVVGMNMVAPEAKAAEVNSDSKKIEISINKDVNYDIGGYHSKARCFDVGLSSVNQILNQMDLGKSFKETKVTCKQHGNRFFGEVSIKDTMITSSRNDDQVIIYRGKDSVRFLMNPAKKEAILSSIKVTVFATEGVPTEQWSASKPNFTQNSNSSTSSNYYYNMNPLNAQTQFQFGF